VPKGEEWSQHLGQCRSAEGQVRIRIEPVEYFAYAADDFPRASDGRNRRRVATHPEPLPPERPFTSEYGSAPCPSGVNCCAPVKPMSWGPTRVLDILLPRHFLARRYVPAPSVNATTLRTPLQLGRNGAGRRVHRYRHPSFLCFEGLIAENLAHPAGVMTSNSCPTCRGVRWCRRQDQSGAEKLSLGPSGHVSTSWSIQLDRRDPESEKRQTRPCAHCTRACPNRWWPSPPL
jgi:hypothetical protein